MDNTTLQPIVDLVTQTGIWCVTAYGLGRYILNNGSLDRKENKEEKERLYSIIDNQGKILEQQKELIGKQVIMAEHNKEMLDRLTKIQMLHTNRLDRIEDRQTRLEEEMKELNRSLQDKNKKGVAE